MPYFTRGKVKFEHIKVGTAESTADAVEAYSCHPPKTGRRLSYNPQLTYDPFQPAKFLDKNEKARMEKFAAKPGENLQLTTIIADIKKEFDIGPLTIDLKSMPQRWRRPVPCQDHTISIVVQSVLLRIDAIATQDLTEKGVSWAKDELLAQFRFIIPDKYRFVKHIEHNIKCCPVKKGTRIPVYKPEGNSWSTGVFTELSIMKVELSAKLNLDPFHDLKGKNWYPDYDGTGDETPKQPWVIPYPPAETKDKKN